MAEALVGGAFLSAFLQVLFDRMASRKFTDFFRGRKVTDGLLEKLETTLRSMNAVLEDAEEKQVTKSDVNKWLDDLKDTVYRADDILDEIATKALRLEVDAEFQTHAATKVRTRISTFSFFKKIEPKIKYVHERLEFLAKQKEHMGLREGVGGESSKRLPTTSLVRESDILGRDADKETIVNSLLSNEANGGEMCVIPIVGMGELARPPLLRLYTRTRG
jgi:hypothetical protein